MKTEIPEILKSLETKIVHHLPQENELEFRAAFSLAAYEKSDLSLVWPKFAHWLLVDPEYGVIRYADKAGKKAIQQVAELYSEWIAGNKPSTERWRTVAHVANAASNTTIANDVAYAVSRVAYAVSRVAYAADYGANAAHAIFCVANANNAADKKQLYYIVMSDKLIELLKEAK